MKATNPANKERIMPVWVQTLLWLIGFSVHNGKTKRKGECCPDFSCCHKELKDNFPARFDHVARKPHLNLLDYISISMVIGNAVFILYIHLK